MTLSHKILLSMCISFSLQAMKQEQQPLDEYTLIHNACVKAWNTLDRYNPADLHTIDDVACLVSEMKGLKNQKIDAKKIAKFAYDQPFRKPDFENMPYLKNYYAQDKPKWCAFYPYNKYRYVSFVIPLIELYNTDIANKKCTNEEFNILLEAITTIRDIDPEEINKAAQKLYDSVKL